MNKRQKKQICFTIALIVVIFFSNACTGDGRKPFWEADISGVHINEVHIHRYEKMLFGLNPFTLQDSLESHYEEYAFFLDGTLGDPSAMESLYDFVTDPDILSLYFDIHEKWEDPKALAEPLTYAFRFHRYHFPDIGFPQIYSYISGIDYMMPVIYTGDILAIGLDNYLGSDYELYNKLGIPRYQSRWMRPERLVVEVMLAFADARLSEYSTVPETLLDHMIYHGKRQYFLDCMLPSTQDSLKIAYTGANIQWMEYYKGYAWTYKLDNDLLYTTDHRAITQFTGEAPFTSAFGRESAPRTGVWLGWQIVREYMRRNPDLLLPDLLSEGDSRKILSGARYRPG
jgi:hypothetical protein